MSALDSAIEAIERHARNELDAAKARGLLYGYDSYYQDQKFRSLGTEEEFNLPVRNPETGRPSRKWRHQGFLDGRVEHPKYPDREFIREHKTTSEAIDGDDATYWSRLAIDPQLSHYMLAGLQQNKRYDGVLYDVTRKPTIRQRTVTKAEAASIRDYGTYHGFPWSEPVQDAQKETPRMYALRLASDTLKRPSWYFQRRIIERIDRELLEFANELWDVAHVISDAARKGQRAFYRNPDHCVAYGRTCEYLGVCSGCSDFDIGTWEESDRRPNVLSHSRVKMFKNCPRKYYYRYEIGFKKPRAEAGEALLFGDLWHAAIGAWWNAKAKETECATSQTW